MSIMTRGNRWTYAAGFLISLALTLTAYLLVNWHVVSGHLQPTHEILVPVLTALAAVQLVTQLVLFLHLGSEPRPRWNLLAFGFMLVVLVILVFGSWWIMNNLNYHMMSPVETLQYMHNHEGL